MQKVRVDSWLWAVRLLPSRSSATAACKAGHVQINGARAKPASGVGLGDQVHVRLARREWLVVVDQLLVKRVGAALAVLAYQDHSPPPPSRSSPLDHEFAVRDRGTGRPTKAQRRQLDKLRGRPSA
ncbi:MAG: S4 domain-containing protein [Micrococcales bacterium]|nr:S4 domain-containing protein [Micrococcales bacterium]